jgi:hypothetical protein
MIDRSQMRQGIVGKGINDSRYRDLIDALRAARVEAGLSQVVVAGRLGRAQSFVSKYESGERRLKVNGDGVTHVMVDSNWAYTLPDDETELLKQALRMDVPGVARFIPGRWIVEPIRDERDDDPA